MCKLQGGLMITPGHPVKHLNKWVYPRDVVEPMQTECEYIYNLLVDRVYIATINEIELILLGHTYQEGILKHEYLGSNQVVNFLQSVPGYNQGIVELHQGSDGCIRMLKKNLKSQIFMSKTNN